MLFEEIKANNVSVFVSSGLDDMHAISMQLSRAFPGLLFELSASDGSYKPEPHTVYKNGIECFKY